MSVKRMNIEMLTNFRYLVDKLVYHGDSDNYAQKRQLILSELTRLYHEFNKQLIKCSTYKHVFHLRSLEWNEPNTFEIVTSSKWTLSINVNRIHNLLEYLQSEGIDVDEYNIVSKGSETSLVGR